MHLCFIGLIKFRGKYPNKSGIKLQINYNSPVLMAAYPRFKHIRNSTSSNGKMVRSSQIFRFTSCVLFHNPTLFVHVSANNLCRSMCGQYLIIIQICGLVN